ncbi:hypothetical protein MVEN_00497000 [Mycena venus]|uniref:Uncharacterized protein n=1 Tax=Mycena venus TaxID=2733690 RepID=A0A8H6YWW6_9AGAR|nr:hypothetical protein MVEN_00497000 [Mycena venus]
MAFTSTYSALTSTGRLARTLATVTSTQGSPMIQMVYALEAKQLPLQVQRIQTPKSSADLPTLSSTSVQDTNTPSKQTSSSTPSQTSPGNTESRLPSQSTTLTVSLAPSISSTTGETTAENTNNNSSGQLPSPSGVQGGSTNSDRNRNKTSTAAISASVISVFLLACLLFMGLWLKRRRRRNQHDKLLEPYTADREKDTPSSANGMVHPNTLPKDQKPSAGSSSAPVEPESAILVDTRDGADDGEQHPTPARIAAPDVLAEEKFGGTAGTSNESYSTPIDSGNGLPSDANTRPNDNMPQEETLAQRVQRMEAQLNALLTMGVGEGAPPSYTG